MRHRFLPPTAGWWKHSKNLLNSQRSRGQSFFYSPGHGWVCDHFIGTLTAEEGIVFLGTTGPDWGAFLLPCDTWGGGVVPGDRKNFWDPWLSVKSQFFLSYYVTSRQLFFFQLLMSVQPVTAFGWVYTKGAACRHQRTASLSCMQHLRRTQGELFSYPRPQFCRQSWRKEHWNQTVSSFS